MKKTIAMLLTVSQCLCGYIAFSADVKPIQRIFTADGEFHGDQKSLDAHNKLYDDIKAGKDTVQAIIDFFNNSGSSGTYVLDRETDKYYIFKSGTKKYFFQKASIPQIMSDVEKWRKLQESKKLQDTAVKPDAADIKPIQRIWTDEGEYLGSQKSLDALNKFYDNIKAGKDTVQAIVDFETNCGALQAIKAKKFVFERETDKDYIFKTDDRGNKHHFPKSSITKILADVEKWRKLQESKKLQSAAGKPDAAAQKQTAGK